MASLTREIAELYRKQRFLRNLSMADGDDKAKDKMRKEQDEYYKKFKFYKGIQDAMDLQKN